ncbi:murein biosynthesis integral membrane protein MurJ [Prochlorococcus sp. MIT 1341]|uniref:murein biosynthesis integral membrane protein MurJ n=1 Tax=Prochlorococcus sp. MIT 1341 TaxID=3096221 RepID=UPI002A7526C6|nr:murein biosynthesis integral membrane protein MurJ [Prochlorococcus sp. MIT 1341]
MAKSLKRISLIVTLGTLLSKAGGLARQLVIAAAFGVGAAYEAFNYAYIIPGFLLVILGGINGPFHSAMVSVLSKRPKNESPKILTRLNTLISTLLGFFTLIILVFADPLIHLVGPGLSTDLHEIAVIQLRIMSPITFLAGLIGLGFGTLNATNQFWIPAISPLMSSLAIIVGVTFLWIRLGSEIASNQFALQGGIVLACAALTGALLQWVIQLPGLISQGFNAMRVSWDWKYPGVMDVWKVMGPATLSSGMLQINVFTDLFFASGIIGAAAGLSYATFIIQTPLGLISNALLVPLLPTFSKLAGTKKIFELKERVSQSLMLSTTSMISLGAVFIALSGPIVALVYQRGAFDKDATTLVASLLIAYGIGMPVYLARDLLVRVFYSLEDAKTPLFFSAIGIGLNIFLDWIFVGGPTPWGNQFPFNFGAIGLVLATAGVNLFTCTALIVKLQIRLNGLPLKTWCKNTLKLFLSGLLSGFFAWSLKSFVAWPETTIGLLLQVIISTATSIVCFGLIGSSLKIQAVEQIRIEIRNRLTHH